MTTITLDVPDDVAQRLRQFESATLVEILRKFLEFLDLLMVKPVITYEKTPLDKSVISYQEWQQSLLTMSAWADDDIQEIEQAREYINQWQPQEFA